MLIGICILTKSMESSKLYRGVAKDLLDAADLFGNVHK